jgi:hypothetical protein
VLIKDGDVAHYPGSFLSCMKKLKMMYMLAGSQWDVSFLHEKVNDDVCQQVLSELSACSQVIHNSSISEMKKWK